MNYSVHKRRLQNLEDMFHYANKGGRSENNQNLVREKGNITAIILFMYVHAWMLFKMRPAAMAFCS